MTDGVKRLVLLVLGLAVSCLQACQARTQDRETVDTLSAQRRDWAALSHYRDANRQIRPPATDEARVVFFGDSITALWSDPTAGSFFPGKPYFNRGISGQTTPQMLIRVQQDVIALQPRVVVILAGTNDIGGVTGPTSIEAIADNVGSMITLARASGIRVVLASVLPTHDDGHDQAGTPTPQSKTRPPEQITALNQSLKELAHRHGAVYLDYYTAMQDGHGMLRRELSDDGLHPNRNGYAVMAPLVEQAIAVALAGST